QPCGVPADMRDGWRAAGQRGRPARLAWEKRVTSLPPDQHAEFNRRLAGDLPVEALAGAVRGLKETLAAAPKDIATRASSELALGALTAAVPEMIGGGCGRDPCDDTPPPTSSGP